MIFIADQLNGRGLYFPWYLVKITPLCQTIANNPVHIITSPDILYIQFIITYCIFVHSIWLLSGGNYLKYEKEIFQYNGS
jgi:hypothetical protein